MPHQSINSLKARKFSCVAKVINNNYLLHFPAFLFFTHRHQSYALGRRLLPIALRLWLAFLGNPDMSSASSSLRRFQLLASNAIASTCIVCGNISTGCTHCSIYPSALSLAISLDIVAGLQDT